MKQFKNYKCPRMRNLLGIYFYKCLLKYSHNSFKMCLYLITAVQMADEYYNAKDYSKALTFVF
jgi:hypothetical protein